MAVSTPQYLKKFSSLAAVLGAKAINSDMTFEIEGFEETYLLAKQSPWVVLTPQEGIEVPGPMGSTTWQPQQVKTSFQGQISLQETTAGTINTLMIEIIRSGGIFNANCYEGTPLKFLRYKRYINCFIQLDVADRDWENRSQPLMFSGTLFGHYYGDDVAGNSPAFGPEAYR